MRKICPSKTMEEKTVLGSRLNGEFLSILFAGDTTSTYIGRTGGRPVPKHGDKVTAIKEVNSKTNVEYTNYYW
jgi:hypothetical protein